MKRHALLALATFALVTAAPAQSLYDETYNFTPNAVIPDGDLNGIALSQNITTSSILSLENGRSDADISGGLNGDYYAYLVHTTPGGTGFSILLNRVGRTGSIPMATPMPA